MVLKNEILKQLFYHNVYLIFSEFLSNKPIFGKKFVHLVLQCHPLTENRITITFRSKFCTLLAKICMYKHKRTHATFQYENVTEQKVTRSIIGWEQVTSSYQDFRI